LARDPDNILRGSEDCLYIELSTKSIKSDTPLPVMFWIGSFMYSRHLDEYLDESLLIDHDVLFVRCGSRLGPFGFLSINDFSAPGNCGLKDIVMALKWIQNNVAKFGGDPSNVTIFGTSTGASAVHLLVLSPMASGLFHKAIIQSASALNNWSLTKNPSRSVIELAKKLGITKSQDFEIVEELRSISAEDLITAASDLQDDLLHQEWNTLDAHFKPCIENDLEGQQAFLTKSPLLILKSGNFNRIPIIIGSTNIEGSIVKYFHEDFFQNYQKYNNDVSLIVPKSLAHDTRFSKDIALKLLNFYLDGETVINENTVTQLVQIISDYYFLYYVNKTVRLHNEISPECSVFYYIVNCAGEWNVPAELGFLCNLGHSSEIGFIFGIKSKKGQDLCKGNRDSIITRNRFVKLWTNFAKYG
jgi:carboxylesterase type B